MAKEPPEKSKELPEKLNDQERSWAGRNGGLIFILVAFGIIGLVVLYEALVR